MSLLFHVVYPTRIEVPDTIMNTNIFCENEWMRNNRISWSFLERTYQCVGKLISDIKKKTYLKGWYLWQSRSEAPWFTKGSSNGDKVKRALYINGMRNDKRNHQWEFVKRKPAQWFYTCEDLHISSEKLRAERSGNWVWCQVVLLIFKE